MALLGPRQVGKTTLAHELAKDLPSVYLDLENPIDASKVQDIQLFCANNPDRLIILDAVQRLPGVFALVRGLNPPSAATIGRIIATDRNKMRHASVRLIRTGKAKPLRKRRPRQPTSLPRP